MSLLKKSFITLFSFLFLFAVNNLAAQEKTDKSLNKKIKNVKGTVQKIVISTKEGNTIFTGSEAMEVFKRLKNDSDKIFKVIVESDDNDLKGENVFAFDSDSDEDEESHFGKNLTWVSESNDSSDANIEKKVMVNTENGEKIVTVTTNRGGKETVKKLTGEKAEKYLKKHSVKNFNAKMMSGDKHANVMFFGKGKNKFHKKGNKFWVEDDESNKGINKNIEVEKEDGELKVTVTTTKDGKKEVKTYEGEDAEKFLEENGDYNMQFENDDDGENIIILKTCDDDSCGNCSKVLKSKKIKVKVIEKEEKDDD